jgi:NAD(P)-dependent dehydrogenase (short-subunit alcohol dehydrogenase family)
MAITAPLLIEYAKRCNCISPARVHTPFVDGYLKNNYPGREQEMFEKLSKSQPIGRMAEPEEVASLALFLCSDEACADWQPRLSTVAPATLGWWM